MVVKSPEANNRETDVELTTGMSQEVCKCIVSGLQPTYKWGL